MISARKTRHRGACIENVLWEVSNRRPDRRQDPRYEVGVEATHLVSAVVNAYGFERLGKVEQQLMQVCQNHDAIDGLVDWREIVCALHALNNTGHCYKKPMKLLQHFFAIYALPSHANVVAREDILALVALAAVRDAEVAETKHAMDACLKRSEICCKDPEKDVTPRYVDYSTFRRAVTKDSPAILAAFKAQMWRRLPSSQKLTYLQVQEEASNQWLEKYIYEHNVTKANSLWKNSTLVRHYRRWCEFLRKRRALEARARRIGRKRCVHAVQLWHAFVLARRVSLRRRRVALVLGRRALLRRVLLRRWRRWARNERRVRDAAGVSKEYQKRVAHGFFYLRVAARVVRLRRSVGRWHETAVHVRTWETARDFAGELRRRWHLRAWKEYYLDRRAERLIERDCVRRQEQLQRILQEAEDFRKRAEAKDAARREAREEAEKERERIDKREVLAWKTRRRAAERAADDRITAAIQQEDRAKQAAILRKERSEAFAKTWDKIEIERVEEQREKTTAWLAAKDSKDTILKEFKRIRREFYQPPTPRSMDREAKLKSLASIVLIKIEAILFQQGLLLQDVIRQYDKQARGYLSHDEFRRLVDDLPVDLSAEQVRQIIREIDADDDGYVDLGELEYALETVHRYNGLAASPWRQYIDPAQDVMCYTNLTTGESILEHRMTNRKLAEITRANYLAETELAAIKQARQDRKEAWDSLVVNDAAATVQRLYRRFKARMELDRLDWKIRSRIKKDREVLRDAAARRVQQWYRSCRSQWLHGLAVRLHVEAIPDLSDGRLYYYNHKSGACSWDPPPKPVHRPHDFVGTGPYVQWDVPPGQPLRRIFQKPPGVPRCTRCLQSLALLRCDAAASGVFCFGCFRETVDLDVLRAANGAVDRVTPTVCSFCERSVAAWRCTRDRELDGRLEGRVACGTCQKRVHSATTLAWARL
ncbi:hypothetical protein CTAYLR_003945 [Chrysophaeum taylorii]|uniref:Calmodulin n=1 Tax=Chrysophaeum taylorii TaxID=2483200 RepID=A0AAD7XJL2_9STRA|nr:hypothetical protein CTAYLR_003945 [Chrysophaeum taylorii]